MRASTPSGRYLLAAYNTPSGVTVHRLKADGTIGAPVAQPGNLDTGIYAHQIRVAPDNRTVILVTRGNNAGEGKPEDPGAIKTFRFNDGVLTNLASIAPGNGLGFGPRHLDFHPTKPWAFVSVERQNKLYVYALDSETGLSRAPLFTKETLSDPKTTVPQGAGPIHVHPNGKFVYLTNRTFPASGPGARKVAPGGENSVAAFAVDRDDGRAEADAKPRRPRPAIAHFRHRSERPASGRRQHHGGRGRRAAGRHHGDAHRRRRQAFLRAQIRRRCR